MWRWQSKGVRDAIPGLCSREGRAGLPGGQGGAARAGGAARGWAGGTSDLAPQGMADRGSFPEQ